jgi:hypothetical protein
MEPVAGKRRRAAIKVYAAVLVLILLVCGFQYYLYIQTMSQRNTVFSSSSDATFIQWQQMGVQNASETTRLLTTLGTALLGGLGLVLGNRDPSSPKRRHLWSALVCAMGACLSLYYGYACHLSLSAMIFSANFDPYSLAYKRPSQLQFYALLVALLFFTDFVVYNLNEEES